MRHYRKNKPAAGGGTGRVKRRASTPVTANASARKKARGRKSTGGIRADAGEATHDPEDLLFGVRSGMERKGQGGAGTNNSLMEAVRRNAALSSVVVDWVRASYVLYKVNTSPAFVVESVLAAFHGAL